MKKLNESAWGEMRHRSSGKVIRKEDDVNFMDFDTLAEYIKDTYSEKGVWFAIRESEDEKSRHIEIEIISGITLSFNEVDGKIYNILVQSVNKYVDVPGLKKVFNVNVLGSSTYSVLEKDWTKSNNTFVKLIEFFLDKKTNESAWGEMRRRSSGESVRKEDEMTQDDLDALDDFIFGFATRVVWDGMNDSLTNFLKYIDENPEALDCVIDRVKKYVEDNWHKGICDDVEAAIEQEDKEKEQDMNESAWGEMRHRSAGKQIRNEDDPKYFTPDEFIVYIKNHYELVKKDESTQDIALYDEGNRIIVPIIETPKNAYSRLDHKLNIYIDYKKNGDGIFIFGEADKYKDILINAGIKLRRNGDVYNISLDEDKTMNEMFLICLDLLIEGIPSEERTIRKKNINESAWGEMRRRSSGEITRKEDDVNHLDFEDFFEYLKSIYISKDSSGFFEIGHFRTPGTDIENISIPFEMNDNKGTPNLSNRMFLIRYDIKKNEYLGLNPNKYFFRLYPNEMRKAFEDKYELDGTQLSITPKDGKITNNVCIDVIDRLISVVEDPLIYKKGVNESAWGEMRRRSSGEITRKEDEINHLDLDGLYDYIKSKYEKRVFYLDKDTFGISNKRNIVVDVSDNVSLYTKYDKNGKMDNILLSWSKVKIAMPFFDKLKERFNVQMPNANRRTITEKDGTCTNKTYIDVIDFFLENMDNMIVNESAWGDMRHRSSGKQIRKEDEIPQDLQEPLAIYIEMFASNAFSGDYTVGSYPDFRAFVRDFMNNSRIESLDFDMGELLDYITQDHYYDIIHPVILDTIDKLNKHINVAVDSIIDSLKNPEVNESAWGDMRHRSSGKQIRKEDEINLLDGDGLYEYIKEHYNIHPNAYIDYDDSLDTLSVPLFAYNTSEQQTIYYGIIDDAIYVGGKDLHPELKKILEDNYNLVKEEYEQYEDYFYNIQPKDNSKINNALFISIIDYVLEQIKNISVVPLMKKKDKVNESAWGEMRQRSAGKQIRKENDMTPDDFLMLRETAKMFRNVLNRSANEPWSGTCEDFIKFINLRKKEHFWNDTPDEVYDKVIKFVKDNWGDCTGIQEFMDTYLSNINECEGVPGGATPANVGGMGAAYFPGPNGEPGSGDLPSPTGIVYHQVAPYTVFLKELKKKKKKKKFRIEDEPCAHSKNSKVYDYVDDYREYVDRTYNNMDKRK